MEHMRISTFKVMLFFGEGIVHFYHKPTQGKEKFFFPRKKKEKTGSVLQSGSLEKHSNWIFI